MYLPIAWLKQYCPIDKDVKELADKITLTGSHVESIFKSGQDIDRVVVGKILSIEKHPDADKLVVCQVDVGQEKIQIVTGAPNVFEGAHLPVALDKSSLAGGEKIKKSKLRGVLSQGMFCSYQELGYDVSVIPMVFRDGVLILDESVEVGRPIQEVLDMDQAVLELEITPNRPDCLSVLGMARETAATFDLDLDLPKLEVEEDEKPIQDFAQGIDIQSPDCHRYYSRVLYDVKIQPSPQWMQNALMQSGVRPINNIVDLTNFVMLELGQPLHAFDLDKVKDKKIIVRNGQEGEVLTTLDKQERRVNEKDILICDGQEAIGLAGVMGGLDSEVTESTKTILLEGALFDAYTVRQTSKKFALRTEASTRFEKGMDPNSCKEAVDRLCVLAKDLGAAKVAKGSYDQKTKDFPEKTIHLRQEKANDLLGTNLSLDQMAHYLKGLGIETKEKSGGLEAKIPSFRQDLTIEEDLVEEVGRLFGFHNITPQPLKGKLTRGGKPASRNLEAKLKEVLAALGYNEWMTFSFMSPKAYDRLNLEEDSPLRKNVELLDPLGEEYSVMRTTLLADSLEVLSKNMNRKNPEAFGYEFGNTFSLDQDQDHLPTEHKRLAIGFYGDQDFYFLKHTIQRLFDRAGIGEITLKRASQGYLHPGRSAEIFVDGQSYGFFGEVHPRVLGNFKMKKRAYVAEVDFQKMVEAEKTAILYQDPGKYPSIGRDLAFILDEKTEIGQVKAIVLEEGGDLLDHFEVFDIYRGDSIDQDKKSVAFNMQFKSKDHTLKDEEINPSVESMIQRIQEELKGQLRDQ
ncbi:Phenylalanine--tRNA ligase beta subunit [Urinicoccus massiliensis]|uniref:Phenylalanine--tRNA ligase beta subunit n=1 Tax=Urinicoccus massiliensis TaxID=1723382 RepID=A0A8H2R1N5_9FIRM|nr:phenylalanine--tRNA ligase subunit beta [Urinicoccus massiliensis]VFB16798.1 Phenylalanine--tRNA ligase beta subunit [Urinicoccus massiliensis]